MKKICVLSILLTYVGSAYPMLKESEYVIALSGMEPKALPKKFSQLSMNEQTIDGLALYQSKSHLAFLVRKLMQDQQQILVTANDEQAFRTGNYSIVGTNFKGLGTFRDAALHCRDVAWYALVLDERRGYSPAELTPTGPEHSTRDWWIKFVTVRNAINIIKNSYSSEANTELRRLIDTAGPIFDSVHTIDIAHTNAIRSLSGMVHCYYEYTPPPKQESSCIIS